MSKFKMGNRFYSTMARLLKDACTAWNKKDRERYESSLFELYQMLDTLTTEAEWNAKPKPEAKLETKSKRKPAKTVRIIPEKGAKSKSRPSKAG